MIAKPPTLRAGALELELSPSFGGAISRFEYFGDRGPASVLRRCNSPLENVLGAASFPLIPFVNRVRGGTFSLRGREIRMLPNMAGDPSPLHGQGWLNPWQVEAAGEAEAVLRFVHRPCEWPWAYEARQRFSLDDDGLTLTLDCRNQSDEPMPCGLGQHPYFDCGPKTRIDTKATHVWTIDEHVLPVEKLPAAGRFDLADRLVCGQDLDHGFAGWGGTALLTDPEWPFDVEMGSSDAGFFQLFSPKKGGIFVAEPVTHANVALNAPEAEWGELGLRILEPGETMSLTMRIAVRPK